MAGGNKTEQPTHKRKQESRKKGDIPFSKDFGSIIALTLSVVIGFMSLKTIANDFGSMYNMTLRGTTGEQISVTQFVYLGAYVLFNATISIAMIGILVGVIIHLVQTGFAFSVHPILPKFETLNPVEGFKKLFSGRTVFELFKMILMTIAVSAACALALKSRLPELLMLPRAAGLGAVTAVWYGTLLQLVAIILAIFVFFAVADWMFQRHHWTKEHMMTRDEVIKEAKEDEGDPHVKGARRELGRQFMNPEPHDVIRNANLVVTDANGRWIGFLFDPRVMQLPLVVGKGKDRNRDGAIAIALTSGIETVYDEALVAACYARAQTNQYIPASVAERVATWYARSAG